MTHFTLWAFVELRNLISEFDPSFSVLHSSSFRFFGPFPKTMQPQVALRQPIRLELSAFALHRKEPFASFYVQSKQRLQLIHAILQI